MKNLTILLLFAYAFTICQAGLGTKIKLCNRSQVPIKIVDAKNYCDNNGWQRKVLNFNDCYTGSGNNDGWQYDISGLFPSDVFFAIARYLPNTTLAQTKSIYNDGWVTVGQIYGRNDVRPKTIGAPWVAAEIDCAGDLDRHCYAKGYGNTIQQAFSVRDIKVYNLVSKDGSFTSQLKVTRQGDTDDDSMFDVDLYTVPPQ